ncbi:cytochrome P450 [Georgenia faecalis]|uniref:cytochrome P450 n=1 Tax=Georgenia faecalis TaxID=2483799 RepID=UPI000FDA4CE7|nr:cytochrome P450 [Georgenia faecalis]
MTAQTSGRSATGRPVNRFAGRTGPGQGGEVPTATLLDGARTLATVMLPVVARGAIVRRPRVVGLVERIDGDRRAVAQMQRVRERYGPGPVQVRIPGRRFTFLLEPDQVHRVLAQSPEPFATATREKRGALSHFQPRGVLISDPAGRARRRPLNDAALQPGRAVHEHGARMAALISEEVDALLADVDRVGVLDWDAYVTAWMRIVRRIVLGDDARDDDAVTDDLLRLRKAGNWSFFAPTHLATRRRFLARMRAYLERAEPGSLAARLAAARAPRGSAPHEQIPQWLFAYDAGAWSSFRALALLSTFPEAGARARAEAGVAPDLPYLRACVLESLRLWPTTPAILRDTTAPTTWSSGTLPAGASVVLFAPFFHRDDTRLPQAHRFSPELWLDARTEADWPLVPFSGGPGMCPGRDVVLLTASTVLARLLAARGFRLEGGAPLSADAPMPGTLSPFRLRFSTTRPS